MPAIGPLDHLRVTGDGDQVGTFGVQPAAAVSGPPAVDLDTAGGATPPERWAEPPLLIAMVVDTLVRAGAQS